MEFQKYLPARPDVTSKLMSEYENRASLQKGGAATAAKKNKK